MDGNDKIGLKPNIPSCKFSVQLAVPPHTLSVADGPMQIKTEIDSTRAIRSRTDFRHGFNMGFRFVFSLKTSTAIMSLTPLKRAYHDNNPTVINNVHQEGIFTETKPKPHGPRRRIVNTKFWNKEP